MRPWACVAATCLAAVLAGASCDRPAPPEGGPVGGDDPFEPLDDQRMRLVSLAPALTQMLVDMGKRSLLVGVGENDAAAPYETPVVGNFQEINTEKLLQVRPTHVLMMTVQEGPPPRLREMAARGQFQLVAYPYPNSVSDVARILFDEDELSATAGPREEPPSLGTVLGARPEALRAKLDMLSELAQLSDVTAQASKPRVLMVIGTAPLTAAGKDTVLDELLRFTGGVNAAEGGNVPAPVFDREKLLAVAPEVVVLLAPGAEPLKPLEQDPRLAELRGLGVPAVTRGRIHLINDPLAVLPSSSMGRVAAQLAKAIHPELTADIDRALSEPEQAPTAFTPAASDDRVDAEPLAR